ncbi:MAG: response regulator transcription factor [Defluviitaleaceae bacterium]|nr:response regulator transcription factor [Defluviitaleaceae bacterium]
MSTKILLVEDNPHISKANNKALTMLGYHVLEAETLEQGKALLLKERPDLIILDVMLPDGSGLDLCEEIRKDSNVPILFLSGLKEDAEIVEGFESGGDVYLTKPYGLNVLVKNVESLLNRSRDVPDTLVKGRLVLNIISKSVTFADKDLDIKSGKEFDVLLYLAKHEGKLVSVSQIYQQVWGQDMLEGDTAVRNIISQIRRKLEISDYTITTEHGKGYMFERG